MLQSAVGSKPLTDIILQLSAGHTNGTKKHLPLQHHYNPGKNLIAVPNDWLCPADNDKLNIVYYREDLLLPEEITKQWGKNRWLTFVNGRFAAKVNNDWLLGLFYNLKADVVAVNIDPELRAGNDKALVTRGNRIMGFRRYYEDTAEQALICDEWPHLLFVKANALDALIVSNTLCLCFPSFIDRCHSNKLLYRSFKVAGQLLDLNSPEGLLSHLKNCTNHNTAFARELFNSEINNPDKSNIKIAANASLIGKVFLGQNVTIDKDTVVIGPAVISDNATISQGSLIRTSIIGPGVRIERKQIIDSQVIMDGLCDWSSHSKTKSISGSIHLDKPTTILNVNGNGNQVQVSRYRTWPTFSYAKCFKRSADILFATVMLLLFAPILPIIALVVKITSPGPVFYRDKRQGLHGEIFYCIKFRTMVIGADKMQDKLRIVSEVDGPQFKIDDDPRVSKVGEFLRDTYIDEIPQFFNVLAGHMSIVGPRPSPESENTLCTYWRDARLSVQPGITGLWQICRTRQPMKDFQEWIHYDTEYVRNLSFRLDMWICWQTFKKLVMNFVRKF